MNRREFLKSGTIIGVGLSIPEGILKFIEEAEAPIKKCSMKLISELIAHT